MGNELGNGNKNVLLGYNANHHVWYIMAIILNNPTMDLVLISLHNDGLKYFLHSLSAPACATWINTYRFYIPHSVYCIPRITLTQHISTRSSPATQHLSRNATSNLDESAREIKKK